MSDNVEPDNWEKKSLGDILDVLTDYTANGSFEALRINVRYYYDQNHAALVRTTDLGKSEFKPKVFTDEKGYIFQRKTALFGGEIVLANVGSIGKVYKVPPYPAPMTLAPNTYLVKFNQSVSQNYIFHFLTSDHYVRQLFQKIGSTALAAINKASFRSIEAILPKDKAEQSAIAQVLDTLDTAISETEAIIAKLKAVRQGLLHDLLTRGIDPNGELRPPQTEAPHLYKESPLGWIPKEWNLSTIGAQFEIQLGKMLDGQKNSGVLKPYVGNKAVQWDRIDLDEVQQVRLSKSDLIRFRLRKGDLLVCEGGEVGRGAIWDDELDECYYQKALHRLRPLQGYRPRLMLEILRYLMGRDALSEYISKTSIAHLTQEKLANVPLPTPNVEEQDRLASEILGAKQRQEAEESQLQKLKLLKSGLIDDLLTGRVRVTPLLAEAAQQKGIA